MIEFALPRGSVAVAAALVFVWAAAWWSYRVTVPPLRRARRVSLGALRGVALTLVVLLIADPVFTFRTTGRLTPRVVVLLDVSRSMARVEDGSSRFDRARAALDSLISRLPTRRGVVLSFDVSARGGAAREPSGEATAIGEALLILERADSLTADAGAVVVISDGGQNYGADPVAAASRLGLPVFAIAVGDATSPRDASISRIECSDVAYSGVETPVAVIVSSTMREGDKATVSLRYDAESVEDRSVVLGPDGSSTRVEFAFTPDDTGRHVLRAVVSGGADAVPENDEYARPVAVRSSKMRVLVVPGALTWETAFLLRALSEDENLQVDRAVPLGGGRFARSGVDPRAVEPSRYDVVFLVDPDASTFAIWGRRLGSAVRSGACGLGLFLGRRSASPPPPLDVRDVFPADVSYGLAWGDGQFHPRPSRTAHPLTILADDRDAPSALWQSLPPWGGALVGEPRQGVMVLATHPRAGSPAITLEQVGGGRVVALWGGPVWRWGFTPSSLGGSRAAYERFVANVVRVLSVRGPVRRVAVRADSPVVRSGEPIGFEVQVIDDDGRPRSGARVSVARVSPGGSSDARSVEQSAGVFRGKTMGVGAGDVRLVATAFDGDVSLGSDTAVITVLPASLEDVDPRARYGVLSAIAAASDGALFGQTGVDSAAAAIASRLRPRRVEHASETVMRSHPIGLALPLVLLACEWMLRRRWRLV